MNRKTVIKIIAMLAPIALMAIGVIFSKYLMDQSSFYEREYSRLIDLAASAETWNELSYYTSWAHQYRTWSDAYFFFSFTILITLGGLSLNLMYRVINGEKASAIQEDVQYIRDVLHTLHTSRKPEDSPEGNLTKSDEKASDEEQTNPRNTSDS